MYSNGWDVEELQVTETSDMTYQTTLQTTKTVRNRCHKAHGTTTHIVPLCTSTVKRCLRFLTRIIKAQNLTKSKPARKDTSITDHTKLSNQRLTKLFVSNTNFYTFEYVLSVCSIIINSGSA